ncbi:PduL/EutD family phosphate acyltransferase [Pseudoflavonifractor phocaeensis]|uniref:PduL/EutD family phosphate acyltransferase n=1 Tax=Pseudoflavonifractor phocaeensis TaxID=1870988 RepID=UPI00195A6040|nr:PduL/EutD family phosphate acyltransferase [Pseudoflavonifractor phocaeensis]MBM6924424.1 hypothetical protein [Pseudoflavonifractor phocaeensis]
MTKEIKILAEASGRHVHLCQADLKALFGPEAELEPKRLLGDGGGGYISQYKVTVEGADGKSCLCTVLGPLRKESQVEFSFTEARAIGLVPPLGDSGVLGGTAPVRLTGPAGTVALERGLFVARRHAHVCVKDAQELGIQDGDPIRVRVAGPRAMVFDEVVAHVPPPFVPMTLSAFHVDYDEWNAAALFLEPYVYMSKP